MDSYILSFAAPSIIFSHMLIFTSIIFWVSSALFIFVTKRISRCACAALSKLHTILLSEASSYPGNPLTRCFLFLYFVNICETSFFLSPILRFFNLPVDRIGE